MKQPGDAKTLELMLDGGKRGRGRPPKADAMTAAERAKRYRDAKRSTAATKPIKSDVTENSTLVSTEEYMRLKRMYWSLEGQVDMANAERDAAFKRNAELEKCVEQLERDVQNGQTINMIESDCREERENRCAELQDQLDVTLRDKATITHQAAALAYKVQALEAKVQKRKA